ncbi:PilC/PilY family type IV pilus protein [Pseudoxanthomonas sp. J35]|uniref:pilus assembly protein n=1 Tax=Pseudoxanthomonas sp. J35 TaxID=935852 RepID=UPI0004B81375|nr:PilC/PilY family type IV pilus protein [Pseudoxanthomonas sp. J35]
MNKKARHGAFLALLKNGAFAFAATLLALPADAGINLPREPLQSSGRVAPNILYVLDDSGSMAFDAMPANSISGWQGRTYIHNTVYYNPARTYQPWTQADGTLMTGGTTYDAVYGDFNLASGPTINLASSNSCRYYNKNNSSNNSEESTQVCGGVQTFYVPIDPTNTSSTYLSQQANYYRYQIFEDGVIVRSIYGARSGTSPNYNRGLADRNCSTSTGTQYRECTRITPTGRSEADERTNYAIWFSYHRTRMKAAKAGSGIAFNGLAGNVRVGFRTIWQRQPGGTRPVNEPTQAVPIPVQHNDGLFANPNGLNGTLNNRTQWFNRLYGAIGYNGTPLKGALQQAGLYFSSNSDTGPYGPQSGSAQYSCRQNFTILTTDGYWNDNTNYTAVNEQDNNAGPTITGPGNQSYTYAAVAPYASSDSNTLADVAMRYWKNDLRTDLPNQVPTTSSNPAFWQHMVTFGISIGLKGEVDPNGPRPGTPGGPARWPNPNDAEDLHRIDDLYHAAVNGRGTFLAASNPDEFAEGLRASLASIVERTGSFSNLSANSTQLTAGSRSYQGSFISGVWTGNLIAYPVVSGSVNQDAPIWNAAAGIPATGRRIFTYDGTGGAVFPTAAQVNALERTTTPAVTGANNAAYIAGNRSLELANGGTLRNRNHLLGDIVNSSPVYAAREQTIYVGANDGMLHAFNANDGVERFAYVPGGISLSDLSTLSLPDYEHRYFVDGSIVVSDRAQTPGATLLVGALGRGGKGIYSLDVTSPDSFSTNDVKWERYETPNGNMGLVLGQPIIAKLNNGVTGVIVPNGVNSSGDRAALLVYRLSDGQLLAEIDTGVGSAAAPNGLYAATIRDLDGNGTADYVYAGDLQGNLWKFDLRSNSSTTWSAGSSRMILYTAVNDAGQRQPITSAPAVVRDPSTFELWVFFGTGRFLNEDDVISTQVQSMYGVKDGASTIAGRGALQRRVISLVDATTGARAFEAASALTAGRLGWYIDLVDPPYPPGTARGERIVSDPQVVAGILIVSSVIPSRDPCLPGGSGYLNALDAFTGASLGTSLFDHDGDGVFDDEVITGGGRTLPVGSVPLGGMGTQGAIFTGGGSGPGGGGGQICVNISDASVECERIREMRRVGRVSWREIIRD